MINGHNFVICIFKSEEKEEKKNKCAQCHNFNLIFHAYAALLCLPAWLKTGNWRIQCTIITTRKKAFLMHISSEHEFLRKTVNIYQLRLELNIPFYYAVLMETSQYLINIYRIPTTNFSAAFFFFSSHYFPYFLLLSFIIWCKNMLMKYVHLKKVIHSRSCDDWNTKCVAATIGSWFEREQ